MGEFGWIERHVQLAPVWGWGRLVTLHHLCIDVSSLPICGYQYWNKAPTLQRRLSPAGEGELGHTRAADRARGSSRKDHRLHGRWRGIHNRREGADTNEDH